nr:hypothetical protein [Micromonospora sp. DSM 115978]
MTAGPDPASLPVAVAAGARTAGAVIRAARPPTRWRRLAHLRHDHRGGHEDPGRTGTTILGAYARPIRDLVTGRVRAYHARLRRFDDADWRGYGQFLDLAFVLAVGRRFHPGQDQAPIIRFVATVRGTYDHGGGLDPTLAEHLISVALGERRSPPTDQTCVAARTLMLIALLRDEGITGGPELDRFLRLVEDLGRTDDPSLDAPL